MPIPILFLHVQNTTIPARTLLSGKLIMRLEDLDSVCPEALRVMELLSLGKIEKGSVARESKVKSM
jgi:hypothetical protein